MRNKLQIVPAMLVMVMCLPHGARDAHANQPRAAAPRAGSPPHLAAVDAEIAALRDEGLQQLIERLNHRGGHPAIFSNDPLLAAPGHVVARELRR